MNNYDLVDFDVEQEEYCDDYYDQYGEWAEEKALDDMDRAADMNGNGGIG